MTFRGTLVEVRDLYAGRRAEMRALLDRHFDGVTAGDFEADLAEKDHAVLLLDGAGRLAGFSTLRVYRSAAAGVPRRVLFSGDTIVAPDAWRSAEGPRAWLAAALALRAAGAEPLDWFLISSGHRTYRAMVTMFRDHVPSAARHDPALQARAAAYARERYGAAFDEAAGVVRLTRSAYRLRPGVGDVTEERLRDPAVALFAALNPGHARGDDLVCLAEIEEGNLTRAGRRLLGRR